MTHPQLQQTAGLACLICFCPWQQKKRQGQRNQGLGMAPEWCLPTTQWALSSVLSNKNYQASEERYLHSIRVVTVIPRNEAHCAPIHLQTSLHSFINEHYCCLVKKKRYLPQQNHLTVLHKIYYFPKVLHFLNCVFYLSAPWKTQHTKNWCRVNGE